MTGTITTNGHELKVLASSLTKAASSSSLKKLPNTTRSKLKDVQEALADDDQVATIFENQESYVVVGIDPGIRSTATCCILDSSDVGRPGNVAIPQGAHTFTTKAYNQGLDYAKKKANIHELEDRIVPIGCPLAETGRQKTAWRHFQLSIHDHYQSVLKVAAPLRAFYTEMMFKIKSYRLKQALNATVTKEIDRVKGEPGAALIKPLFVVGDGQFGAAHGNTLHQKFIDMLKKRAEGLGLHVVCADEWGTSLVCCQCKQVGVLDGRTLKCEGCERERDRDHNGTHNIARATLHWIDNFEWPPELTRPSK